MNKRLRAIAIVVVGFAATAVLSAAVAVPAVSAKSAGQVKLSALPLPKSSLGSAAQRLRLEQSSGVVRDFGWGLPLTPNHSWGRRGYIDGRISGYALDYGLGASGAAGVTEVRTSVDEYYTNADAKSGLSVWKGYDRRVSQYDRGGLSVAFKAEKIAPVGSRRFAFLVRYGAANIAPLFGLDEQFTLGRYEADVTVWAGRAVTVEKLAPKIASKLEARIKRALAGRLHAKPVKIPASRKGGPPPGGPDLSQLGLTPTDLGVQASSWDHGYAAFYGGYSFSEGYVSGYSYGEWIAGQFGDCGQVVHWFATANEAGFAADFTWSETLYGRPAYPPPVDLSNVGDGAEGVLSNGSDGGYAFLVFSSGRLAETVYLHNSSAISSSDVQSIAQTVASKINAAGLGS